MNVRLGDIFPSNYFDFISASTQNGTYDNEFEIWDIGFMGNGTDATLYIYAYAKAVGNHILNMVVVASDTDEWNLSNNFAYSYVDVLDIPKPVKTVDNSTPDYHTFVVYNMTIENPNDVDYMDNLTVIDSLPTGLEFAGTVGIDGAVFVGDESVNGQTVTWVITNISAKSSAVISVKVKVNALGNLTNNLTIIAPNGVNSTVNCTITPVPVVDIYVNITSDKDEYFVDEVAVWTISVTNDPNSVMATSVTLKDLIPSQFEYINCTLVNGTFDPDDDIWSIGDMPNGTSVVLKVFTRALRTGKNIDSVVQVKCDEKEWNLTNNIDDKMVDIIDLPNPVKTVDNSTPDYNDIVVYNLTIQNPNNVTYADNLTVIDSLPDGLVFNGTVSVDGAVKLSEVVDGQKITWVITNISAKSSAVITVKVFVNDIGNLTNNLTVIGPRGTNVTVNCTITPVPIADLEIIKSNDHEDTECYHGDPVNWDITVINHGPNDAVNVIVTEKLPYGVEYVSDDSNGAYDPETGIWNVGNLTNGASVTLHILTTITGTNPDVTNPVKVTSDTKDPDESNNKDNSSVTVILEADLEIVKSVSNSAPHKGDKITWTLTVTNNGRDAAVNTVVRDKLPSGLIYFSDDSKGAYNPKTGIWKVGNLACGESATLNIVTVVAKTNATIINFADVTSDSYDPNETNNKCNNSTTVPPEADLVLTKDANTHKVVVGHKVKFTIVVFNAGPDTAVNTRAYDVLPDELYFISFKASRGTYDPKTGVWTIGDLKPGERVSLTIVAEALVTGTIVNEAYVESDTYDPDESNSYDNTTVTLEKPSEPPVPKLHATGNPIVMVILSLLAVVGVSLKRKS
jgi:uncharacterized repeat protein (TIGR01451 family)/fimbrial isopeptide formation D2 family protein